MGRSGAGEFFSQSLNRNSWLITMPSASRTSVTTMIAVVTTPWWQADATLSETKHVRR